MYTYPFAIQMAVDESLILSGLSICQAATDDNMTGCWDAMLENNVDLFEAHRVLSAINTIRSPIWNDYMCVRCRFYRGKI